MTPDQAADAFWEWSLAVYARPGVKEALLRLQDRYHYNVNLILWSVWAARAGWEMSPEQEIELSEAVEPLSRYGVERLREVRRYLSCPKSGFDSVLIAELRQDLLAAELKGEKLVQDRLAHLTVEIGGARNAFSPARANETAWIHFQNIAPCLEKPVLLADTHGPGTAADLFAEILELTATEEPA